MLYFELRQVIKKKAEKSDRIPVEFCLTDAKTTLCPIVVVFRWNVSRREQFVTFMLCVICKKNDEKKQF